MTKYHAIRTEGYASKREYRRAQELKLLAKIGAIKSLREQPKFVLIEKSKYGREINYVGDFAYIENDQSIVEDVKGILTPVYKLKKRLMAEKYGIEIRET